MTSPAAEPRALGPEPTGSPYGKATALLGTLRNGKPAMSPDALDLLLQQSGIQYRILTPALGQTAAAAREAVREGCGYLICTGDDWLLHELVNGIMEETGPLNPELVVAMIPPERGSDYLRTFGLSGSPDAAAAHLAGETCFGVDVGRITWGPHASTGYTYFINMAQAGFWADVVRRRQHLPAASGRLGDLMSFWSALALFKVPTAAVRLGTKSYGGPLVNLVVANGQFFRDGIRLAVRAHPGDGKLDVMIQKGSKRDYVASMTRSFKVEHVPSPLIKEYLSDKVELTSGRTLPVEADGRMLGFTPAIFELVPQAFRLKI